jgi:hypothetical protein
MQAPLAILSSLTGIAVWLLGGGMMWLTGGLLIGCVVPFTLTIIRPTNAQLLADGRDLTFVETRALLKKWRKLHAVRTTLSLVASMIFVALLLNR